MNRLWLPILLALLFAFANARCAAEAVLEQVGFERMDALAGELGAFDARALARSVLAGEAHPEAASVFRYLARFAGALKGEVLSVTKALAVPALASFLLALATGKRDGVLTLLCRLSCACVLALRFEPVLTDVRDGLASLTKVAEITAPVLSAAMTLEGAAVRASALSPESTLLIQVIEAAFIGAGIPMCALAAAVVTAGNLSDRFRLDRLFGLIKGVVTWGIGVAMAAFIGLLSIEGRLAAAQDATVLRAVQQVVRNMIPFIGRELSGSSGLLLSSAAAVRNAVGITGMALALWTCARPALRLALYTLSVKLASALFEPAADPGIVRIASGFGDVSGMLLSICVGSAMLFLLLAGACMGMAGI